MPMVRVRAAMPADAEARLDDSAAAQHGSRWPPMERMKIVNWRNKILLRAAAHNLTCALFLSRLGVGDRHSLLREHEELQMRYAVSSVSCAAMEREYECAQTLLAYSRG